MTYEISLPDIMKEIKMQYRKTRKVEKNIVLKNQENYETKVSLNRLNIQIEKQTLFKKKLMNEINSFKKSKKEYENELNDALYNSRIITSKINDQFEEILRLLDVQTVKDDKNEFLDQQIKITNCTNKTTTPLLKRLESENKDKYYKSLCKNLMIQDILSNDINIEKTIKLTEDNISLIEKYHISMKDLKSTLDNVEVCKYNYWSYFDEFYNGVDKTENLKVGLLLLGNF
ncbi:Uncharacterized protein FWK35_00032304 [Aphis craccivora]|uniref:Uncharacterized protein n=1 Tax=Aphis craccivora TaxID=307492 RepID=A0A6G0XXA1_APHCR|nr:Uncharacterized protein FWK35_00032304 [Aphis craccivora]